MSDGKELVTVQTKATFDEFIASAATAMRRVWGDAPNEALAMFWAKCQHETNGWRNCYNWNTGNVKKVDGDGHDWCYLNGVWECYPDAEAKRLIASGIGKPSTKAWQKCAPGYTCVVFSPPHKTCRFRAFESLDRAMYEHMLFVLDRNPECWPFAVAGDVPEFVCALKKRGYFTGDIGSYISSVQRFYDGAIAILNGPQTPEAA